MTKRLGWVVVLALAGALLLGNTPAYADSVSLTGVSDGFGSTFSLTANCTSGTCTVVLTINTTGSTLYPDINAVDFKIGSKDTFPSSGTLTAPSGTWQTSSGSLNSSGSTCGNNSGGDVCSQASSPSSEAATLAGTGGTALSWTWTGVQVSGPIAINHVGYKYNNSSGTLNGLIVSYPFASA